MAAEGSNRACVVIPARLASTRLPRKMLLDQTGKPLLQHTYEAACAAHLPNRVIVATDEPTIAHSVESFGGQAILTSPACMSGTDRVAEVAARLTDCDLIVNVQGDEPEINPVAIDRVLEMLIEDSTIPVATLATPLREVDRLHDSSLVKVIFNHEGRAIYFSRAPIPFVRDAETPPVAMEPPCYYQHLGLYAFRREYLLRLSRLAPTPLEKLEKLEQLRILETGGAIRIGVVDHAPAGIDTPEDYAAFVERQLAARAA